MAISAPGLKRRARADGSIAYYWVASAVSRQSGEYPVKTVPLHYDSDEARAIRCGVQLRQWLAAKGKTQSPVFDGTLSSLIRQYQTLDTSPYFAIQQNTRRDYDQRLRTLDKTVGAVVIARLNAVDFTRWHRNFKKPTEPGGRELIRKAHGLLTMVRTLMSFGVSMRFEGCAGTHAVLNAMEFQAPARRKQAIAFKQAEKIVDLALAAGRPSIALGQALQFELAMRQVDVIGKWVTAEPGEGGIIFRGNRWGGGLLWSHLADDLTVSKVTTKTAAEGEWDLNECPLVLKALAAFPPHLRVGPMIVSENNGRPYGTLLYAREWRPFADQAGVPRDVWNRDSRAGGITEAFEGGATEGDTQHFATHADPSTTRGYRRATLESSKRVAKLRVASRKQVGNKVWERL